MDLNVTTANNVTASGTGSCEVLGVGTAFCEGGYDPHPALKLFPFLVYVPGHPVHGDRVHTEDGRVSVEEIGMSASLITDNEALATKLGTTPEHVRQALSYLSHVLMAG